MTANEELTFVDKVSSEDKETPKKSDSKLVKYRALVDLSYDGKEVAAGTVVSDIPKVSVGWLLDSNCIEKVS